MLRRLHIGAEAAHEGWEVLNVLPADYVDHACNATDLSQFPNNSFAEIYASHIVEHLDFKDGEIESTLKEWWRVLDKGGKIHISVPDMDVLARLFLMKDKLSLDERVWIMKMIFGGHTNEYDYHYIGLNLDLLGGILHACGFVNIMRVKDLGIVEDTSTMLFKGVAISLNVTAEKP